MSIHSQLLSPPRKQIARRQSKCDCTNCGVRLVVNLNDGTVRTYLKIAGARKLEGTFINGLFQYDCPVCDYADSLEEEYIAEFEEEVTFR